MLLPPWILKIEIYLERRRQRMTWMDWTLR
nr:MAG TPA: hypothetical protein [Siphoviridae sp. ctX8T1]